MRLRPLSIALALTLLPGCEGLETKSGSDPAPSIRTLPPSVQVNGPRKALVIGNGGYPPAQDRVNLFGPLANPRNDATDLAVRLRGYGFQVTLVLDADARALRQAVNGFADGLARNDVALVYYSGHGVAVACNPSSGETHNYLVPVGRPIRDSADLCDTALATPTTAQWALDKLNLRQGGANILIFDACREVLALTQAKGFEHKGFAEMHGVGSFIGYASAPGQAALGDRSSRHSLYTDQLLTALAPPNDDLPVERLFQQVRGAVAPAANRLGGQQVPWDTNGLVGDFCFRSPCRPLNAPLVTQAELAQAQQRRAHLEEENRRKDQEIERLRRQMAQQVEATQAQASREAAQRQEEEARRSAEAQERQRREAAAQVEAPPVPVGAASSRDSDAAASVAAPSRLQAAPTVAAPSRLQAAPTVAAPSRLQAAPTVGRGEGPDMVPIPKGCFQMGSPDGEPGRASDEDPQHRVCVPAFELGRYEVTTEEYAAFLNARRPGQAQRQGWVETQAEDSTSNHLVESGGRFAAEPGYGRYPVNNLSWDGARAYAEWLSQETGRAYRLPSEAEWEYAARAGTTTPFSTGACIHTDQANYDGNYDYNNCGAKTGVYLQKTQPVGSYPANPWGLYDVHGNLWEWAEDCWNDNYQGAPTDGSAWRHGNCSQRVLRGGSWVSVPGGLRCADRIRGGAGLRDYGVGFRLARTLTP